MKTRVDAASRAAVLSLCAGLAIGIPSAAFAQAAGPTGKLAMVEQAAAPAVSPADLAAKLPTDSRMVTGTLDNGLSYIVMKHSNPPGRANMYIHVSTGSLNETDQQRGLAHFLEHLAFNGSENFPAGTVVDFFQSMGLTFGQHQNAFTSFDQTAYILSFPDNKQETIARGMKFFGDVSGRLLLAEKEIDNERQVIMEEKRARLSAAQRVQDYVLERLFPGSLIGQRLPIGVEETILGMKRQDFVDYYSKWYVPSNMTVIVVADAEPAEVVKEIATAFSGGDRKPRPVDVDPGVRPTSSTTAIVAHDKEQKRAEISVVMVAGKEPPLTTVGDLRQDLVRGLGTSMFNRRLGAKLAKGGTSFLSGSAFAENLFGAAALRQVGFEGEPAKWKDMLTELGTELQRARLHGFTQREMDDVKREMIAGAERLVEQSTTMRADTLIRMVNNSVATGDTMVGPTEELALYKRILPTITVSEASETFRQLFDTTNVTFVAELPSDVAGGLPTESELVELGKKALDVKPEAEKEAERPTTLMTKMPAPGTLGATSAHAASNVVSGMLSNGVTVHYRFMDYKKDTAWVSINFAAGSLQETADNRGVSQVAALAGATSTLSSTDIRDIMTGTKVSTNLVPGGDTMSVQVSGNPAELEKGLQLAHLLMTDPVIEQPAFDRWKTATLRSIDERGSNPQAAISEAMAKTVFPASEVRTQPLTKAQVEALSPAVAQAWLRNAMATAPIEVSVVGDIPQDKAMKLVETYIGSLPSREKISGVTLDDLRTIKRPVGPTTNVVEINTITPLAIVIQGFYGPDVENVEDSRIMQMAGRILDTRFFKKVREEEQLAYSPGCRVQPGQDYPGFGLVLTASPTEPGKVERLTKANIEVFDEFAKGGPTAEEVETAKKQIANQLDETMKEPSFWLGRTATMTYRNVKLDDVVGAAAFYQSVTPSQIVATFNRYYSPQTSMTCVVKPSAQSSGSGESKGDLSPAAPAAPAGSGKTGG
jgi:zinc protease